MSERLSVPYTFWLHDYSSASLLFPLRSQLIKCEVDENGIALEGRDGYIPLAETTACRTILTGGSSPMRSLVEIQYGAKREHRLLMPANPLMPQDVFNMSAEAEALAEVINRLRNHDMPAVEPNPYYRQLMREGKHGEITRRFWDPNVSPRLYYREDHPRPSVLRLIGLVLLTIVVLIMLLAILATVFGRVEITFHY